MQPKQKCYQSYLNLGASSVLWSVSGGSLLHRYCTSRYFGVPKNIKKIHQLMIC